jgi:hypothetical protein
MTIFYIDVPSSALQLIFSKLATMQQEIQHMSRVQQGMVNSLQSIVAVKKEGAAPWNSVACGH